MRYSFLLSSILVIPFLLSFPFLLAPDIDTSNLLIYLNELMTCSCVKYNQTAANDHLKK